MIRPAARITKGKGQGKYHVASGAKTCGKLAVGIERLREIVQSADKEWSLLTAKEGGNS